MYYGQKNNTPVNPTQSNPNNQSQSSNFIPMTPQEEQQYYGTKSGSPVNITKNSQSKNPSDLSLLGNSIGSAITGFAKNAAASPEALLTKNLLGLSNNTVAHPAQALGIPQTPLNSISSGIGQYGPLAIAGIEGGSKLIGAGIRKLTGKISPEDFVNNNINSMVIGPRAQNINNALTNFSYGNEASDHPLIPETQYKVNNPAESSIYSGKFSPQQAIKYAKLNPKLFQNNYSGIEGVDPSLNPSLNSDPLSDAISPNFEKLLSKRFPMGNEDFGSPNNPLEPVQAYQDLLKNRDIGSALETHRIFSQSKIHPNIGNEAFKLLDNGAKNIKNNLIVPALRDYDNLNGTNVTEKYLAGNDPYSAEMAIKGDKNLDNLTSGRILPQDRSPTFINNILTKAQQNGNPFVQPGISGQPGFPGTPSTPAFDFNNKLTELLNKQPKPSSTTMKLLKKGGKILGYGGLGIAANKLYNNFL